MAAATDPPMKPFDESAIWVTTAPGPLEANPSLATLVIRLGMASNALKSQRRETEPVTKATGAVAMIDMVMSFITAASFTKEAITILTGKKTYRLKARAWRNWLERPAHLTS